MAFLHFTQAQGSDAAPAPEMKKARPAHREPVCAEVQGPRIWRNVDNILVLTGDLNTFGNPRGKDFR
jgi:hypothetical protein